jgi:hypothetical protein
MLQSIELRIEDSDLRFKVTLVVLGLTLKGLQMMREYGCGHNMTLEPTTLKS